MSKTTLTEADQEVEPTPLWSIRMPEVVPVYSKWLMKTTYVDPEWRGLLGKMEKLRVVGHRFVEPTPPDSLDGPIELVQDKDNEVDPYAIAVYHGGDRIGYIARNMTARVRELWDKFDPTGSVPDRPKLISCASPFELYIIDLP